jgi:hypothetical protein
MKTIITTTIALAIATSAIADTSSSTLKWNGATSNNLHAASCAFGTNGNLKTGTMTYNPNNSTWTTDSDASVTVVARKATEIKVEAQGQLYKSNQATSVNVNVDYRNDWVDVTGAGAAAIKNTATTSPTNTASISGFPTSGSGFTNLKIKLGGTAKVTNPGNLLENSAYQIHHKVTCTY